MATIKSYTDIEQSRKLAEILPLESADMFYPTKSNYEGKIIGLLDVPLYIGSDGFVDTEMGEIYAWSLAALLDVLPSYEINNFGYGIQLDVNREALATEGDETLLDLVVNMIIHLYKLKML